MRWVTAVALLALALPRPAAADGLDVAIGERLFRRAWVPGTASTGAADGLGPLYAARSCAACHRGLARAATRAPDAADHGLAFRLGDRSGAPDPGLGRQIQPMAAAGVAPEPVPSVAWTRVDLPAGAGRVATERPVAAAGAPGLSVSLRAAPALDQVGRLAAIPAEAVLRVAAEQAAGTEGVAGRPHRLADGRIGRFGWKATAATLPDQVADAFRLDLGLSTRRHPEPWGDCTPAQTACRSAPHGALAGETAPEIDEAIVLRLAAFLQGRGDPGAGRPEPRGPGPALFSQTGCATCHRPDLPSRVGAAYTDLLLHDLGPGLDDGVADGAARPQDWRTAPLAGLAAAEKSGLMHDGRARTLEEAVAWHGGEATSARARFFALPRAERRALLDYLRSL
ncbi:di-heme oxidoredictase family protein [Prosthecomicrobium sp. N25]|uniref:di-heme oxidoredictase family protein n=1 Tax=Prosthecomicrobium sp. N25 TaxID=3129254 RepID=UPI00307781D3